MNASLKVTAASLARIKAEFVRLEHVCDRTPVRVHEDHHGNRVFYRCCGWSVCIPRDQEYWERVP